MTTPEEAFAPGQADAAADPPLSQEQADLIAAILAPHRAVPERLGLGTARHGQRSPVPVVTGQTAAATDPAGK